MTWNTNIAYAIGLIVTDGNLSKDGRHITFVSKDIDLMKTFKHCLNINNRITSKTSGFSNKIYNKIQFGNVKFYKWLLDIGLMPNKSKTIANLAIPEKYLLDFLRGHIDGDGCIRKYRDSIYPKCQRLNTCFISASLPHIKWLQKRISSSLRIKGYICRHARGTFELTYAKNESKILLNRLYYSKTVPCLKRKRQIASSFLLTK